ncbi:MAG: hypothetical protein ABSA69_02360 [Verrucomicrobiota bacterium]
MGFITFLEPTNKNTREESERAAREVIAGIRPGGRFLSGFETGRRLPSADDIGNEPEYLFNQALNWPGTLKF